MFTSVRCSPESDPEGRLNVRIETTGHFREEVLTNIHKRFNEIADEHEVVFVRQPIQIESFRFYESPPEEPPMFVAFTRFTIDAKARAKAA